MSRTFQFIVASLSLLLLTGIPVQAGPVLIYEVVQVIGSFQNPADLRLRGLESGSATPATGQASKIDSLVSANTAGSPHSLLEGIVIDVNDPQQGVQNVAEGEVDGTICDCGEIWVPGGFPRWPLVFLAGIPFLFIDGDDTPPLTPQPPLTPEPPSSQPSPTPPNSSVPEPASLLLFGTGLIAFGAGLRRRHTRAKLAAQSQDTEEGRVS